MDPVVAQDTLTRCLLLQFYSGSAKASALLRITSSDNARFKRMSSQTDKDLTRDENYIKWVTADTAPASVEPAPCLCGASLWNQCLACVERFTSLG